MNRRFNKHKSKSNELSRQKTPVYHYFREIGWENVKISLIEEFKFEEKAELLLKEGEIIRTFLGSEKCLNVLRPVVTPEEKKESDKAYGKERRENKERERERLALWRKNNPEKRREQTKRYYECKKESSMICINE